MHVIKILIKKFFCIYPFVYVVLYFYSCSPSQPKKDSLRLNLLEEPTTLDPRKGGDVYSATLHFLLFEGLTKISPRSSGDPGIAYKVDLSEDLLTYTFHLRSSLWSDGSPLTAYDFEYSWKSMLDPSFPSPNAILLYPILHAEEAKKGRISLDAVGIHALDAHTLVVTLKQPTPYFLNITSFCVLFPISKSHAEHGIDEKENIPSHYISNGPYRLVEWKHQNALILEKNPYYWDKNEVDLQGISISFIGDEHTALEMFRRQELDLLGSPYTNIPLEAVEELKTTQLLTAHPIAKTIVCAFNVKHPLLQHPLIRKALSLAIDKNLLVQSIGTLYDIPAFNYVAPVLKHGRNTPLIEACNLPLARYYLEKGLEELHLSREDFHPITLLYRSNGNFRQIAEVLQDAWQKHLGITLQLQAVDHKTFLTKTPKGDFDLCISQWIAQYDDPTSILDRFKNSSDPKNLSKWENSLYAHLLKSSASLPSLEREATLEEAEILLAEELPVIPLMHSYDIYMVQPYVKGLYTSSLGSMHLHKIYFEKEKENAKKFFKED
jgi:oligopeptide transport system substrate-binding protein